MRIKFLFILLIGINIGINAQVITDGLIGHWPLNGNANDLSNNSNNGTIYGATLANDRFSNGNSSLHFENGNHISFGDPAIFDFGINDFSISVWFYRTRNTTNWDAGLLSKWNTGGNPGTNELYLTLHGGVINGNTPSFFVEIGNTNYSIISPTQIQLNQWYHLVAIRRNNQIELYVNGELSGQKTIPNLPINNVGRQLLIGKTHSNHWLNGSRVDDLQIFSRAVNLSEIQTIYTNTTLPSASNCATIFCDGDNVGIGTTDTKGFKLGVNGKIHAKEVKIDLIGWPDFVFFDDYNLPTLKEVESHIKEKGHLKDIPSAKEVEENGIYLGEINGKLLQKIEELMLYTITQQKEIDELQKLKITNNKLEERMLKLETLLKMTLKDK